MEKENVEDTEVIEPTEEVQETETKEEEETKESILSKIRNFVIGKEEKVEEVKVPDEFTKAALLGGWSGEDVDEFAKDYSEEELIEMIPALIGEDSEESDETSDTEETQETKETEGNDSQDDEQVQKLLQRIEALEKAQDEAQEESKDQEIVNLVNRASQIFDEASKEFEVFGKTDKLSKFPDGRIITTSPQMKARNEVWEVARQLHNSGMDFEAAMSTSLNAYKGRNLVKDVKRSVIKDLKKSEKRLSGKRTSHETSTNVASGPEVIREVIRRHGKEND